MLRGFSLAHVAGASSPDDIPWHEQADCTIDCPRVPGDLRVSALRPDLVAEEPRHLAGGVMIKVLGSDNSSLSSSRRNSRPST